MSPTAIKLPKRRKELATPFILPRGAIEHFRTEGYVKLKRVLSAEVLKFYGDAITKQVVRLNTLTKPMGERSTYERAFLQIMNLGTKDEIFVSSPSGNGLRASPPS